MLPQAQKNSQSQLSCLRARKTAQRGFISETHTCLLDSIFLQANRLSLCSLLTNKAKLANSCFPELAISNKPGLHFYFHYLAAEAAWDVLFFYDSSSRTSQPL